MLVLTFACLPKERRRMFAAAKERVRDLPATKFRKEKTATIWGPTAWGGARRLGFALPGAAPPQAVGPLSPGSVTHSHRHVTDQFASGNGVCRRGRERNLHGVTNIKLSMPARFLSFISAFS